MIMLMSKFVIRVVTGDCEIDLAMCDKASEALTIANALALYANNGYGECQYRVIEMETGDVIFWKDNVIDDE